MSPHRGRAATGARSLVIHGDARHLPLADCSVDAVVCDPPAGISFMGKLWDKPGVLGVSGGVAMPQTMASRNPMCRSCHRHKRGSVSHIPCSCPMPDFDDVEARLLHRTAFIAAMTAAFADALRVAKPGAHGLFWALPRTSHWTATALEDAGWEIRDCVTSITGQGFPKSLDISKQFDKMAGVEREVLSEGTPVKRIIPGADQYRTGSWIKDNGRTFTPIETLPATGLARQWAGWGTALKPAAEFWWLVRRPLSERNVALNVLRWGVGAINVDGCRIGITHEERARKQEWSDRYSGHDYQGGTIYGGGKGLTPTAKGQIRPPHSAGRWPSNLLLSHTLWCIPTGTKRVKGSNAPGPNGARGDFGKHGTYSTATGRGDEPSTYADPDGTETVEAFECAEDCPIRLLDEQAGERRSGSWNGHRNTPKTKNAYGAYASHDEKGWTASTGGASRFFYCAKASRAERQAGLPEGMINDHPTQKAQALMRYLCRLVTPPGGIVLDCFMGSGSTRLAAEAEGFGFIGIELDAHYCEIAARRLRRDALPL